MSNSIIEQRGGGWLPRDVVVECWNSYKESPNCGWHGPLSTALPTHPDPMAAEGPRCPKCLYPVRIQPVTLKAHQREETPMTVRCQAGKSGAHACVLPAGHEGWHQASLDLADSARQFVVRFKCGCCVRHPEGMFHDIQTLPPPEREHVKCDMANGCYFSEEAVQFALEHRDDEPGRRNCVTNPRLITDMRYGWEAEKPIITGTDIEIELAVTSSYVPPTVEQAKLKAIRRGCRLTLEEAKRTQCCRVCGEGSGKKGLYVYLDQYAHQSCLDDLKRCSESDSEGGWGIPKWMQPQVEAWMADSSKLVEHSNPPTRSRRLKRVHVTPGLILDCIVHGNGRRAKSNLPAGAALVSTSYDWVTDTVVLILCHGDWEPVPVGHQVPQLEVTLTEDHTDASHRSHGQEGP